MRRFRSDGRAAEWRRVLDRSREVVILAAVIGVLTGRAGPGTADEYIKAVVDPEARFALRPVLGRLVASMATLGGGAAMGFERPSIYLGAAVGAGGVPPPAAAAVGYRPAAARVEHLPVVGDDGVLHGVATTADILDLDDLLNRLDHRRDDD